MQNIKTDCFCVFFTIEKAFFTFRVTKFNDCVLFVGFIWLILFYMKWLVIAPDEHTQGADLIIDFLQQKHTDARFCRFNTTVDSIDFTRNSSEAFTDFKQTLFEASHCIILSAQEIAVHPVSGYIAGVLAGRGIPFFVQGHPAVENHCLLTGMEYFKTAEDLVKEIDRRFKNYAAEEKREQARKKLYKKGLPFTPDCFSIQIANGKNKDCELFLQAGMDSNVCDCAGTPMLCIAARAEKPEMIEMLMKRGADINAASKDRGYTPVMDAIWRNNTELVELIIKYHPDLNTVSNDGQPPLVLAVGSGNADICRILAENGADPSTKDHMGMSAYGYAKLFEKKEIIKILEPYEKEK